MHRGKPEEKAVLDYYKLSQEAATYIGTLFERLFPDYYNEYAEAFEAGKWVQQDPGPFLMRAVVYKLEVKLHHDGRDGGPTVTFPVGSFQGGHMEIPTLGVRYQYVPRNM